MSLESDGVLTHHLSPNGHRILGAAAIERGWHAEIMDCTTQYAVIAGACNTIILDESHALAAIGTTGWPAGSVVTIVNDTGTYLDFGSWEPDVLPGTFGFAPILCGTILGWYMTRVENGLSVSFVFTGKSWQVIGDWGIAT